MGLVKNHTYGVLRIEEIDQQITLIQVRNPHGCNEWNGDWSDNSDKWTDELKGKLKQNSAEDGAFWMDFN